MLALALERGRVWTQEELALLGSAPDAKVAERIGKKAQAVTAMRNRRGISVRGVGPKSSSPCWANCLMPR